MTFLCSICRVAFISLTETECRADKFPHTAAAVSGNRLTHIGLHGTNCRKASKTSRRSVQICSHPPRASFVQPTDQVGDKQVLF